MEINYYNIPNHIDSVSSKEKEREKNYIFILHSDVEINKYAHLLNNIANSITNTSKSEHVLISLKDFQRTKSNIIDQNKETLIVSFGIEPSLLGIQINYLAYTLLKVRQLSFIFTDPVQKISEDKSLKIELWKVLKSYDSKS